MAEHNEACYLMHGGPVGTLNNLEWKKTNDPHGWNWCNWSMKKILINQSEILWVGIHFLCCLSASMYNNINGFLMDASPCQQPGKPLCQAQSPFQIDATQAPGHWSTWKSPTSFSVFASCQYLPPFPPPNSCFWCTSALRCAVVFAQCGKRVCMRMRPPGGSALLPGSLASLLFCM